MRKQASQFWNVYRVFLYFGGMAVVCLLGYLHFATDSSPSSPQQQEQQKQRVTAEIQQLYSQAQNDLVAIDVAIAKSEELAKHNPELGYYWLGRCYDLLVSELQQRERIAKHYAEVVNDPFYTSQRQSYQEFIKKTEALLQKWQFPDKSQQYLDKALAFYEKSIATAGSTQAKVFVVQQHYQAGRFDMAEKLIADAINDEKLREQRVILKFFLADMTYQRNAGAQSQEWDKIVGLYEDVIAEFTALAPQQQKKFARRASFCHLQFSVICQYQGKNEEAERHLARAAELFPQNSAVFFHWARLLFQQQKYLAAESKIQKAIAIAPHWSQAHYLQAVILAKQWDRLASLQYLQQALYLERDERERPLFQEMQRDSAWETFKGNGYFLFITHCSLDLPKKFQRQLLIATHDALHNDLDKAIHLCREVIREDSENYPAHLVQLFCVLGKDNYRTQIERDIAEKQAMAQRDIAPDIKAQLQRYIDTRSEELRRQDLNKEHLQAEIKRLEETTQRLAANDSQRLAIAFCYFRWSSPETVIALVTPAIAQVDEAHLRAYYHYMQGYSHFRLQQYEEALQSYHLAAKDAPEIPAYQYLQGDIHREQNRPQKAIEFYHKALAIADDLPRVHYQLALLLEEQPQKAVEHLQKCCMLNPEDFLAKYQLARAYLLQSKVKEALQTLRNSFETPNSDSKQLYALLRKDQIWHQCSKEPEYEAIITDFQE